MASCCPPVTGDSPLKHTSFDGLVSFDGLGSVDVLAETAPWLSFDEEERRPCPRWSPNGTDVDA